MNETIVCDVSAYGLKNIYCNQPGTKSKSKGVYIYSGNSTILVLDNRRWGAGSTCTSFVPVPRSSLDVAIPGKEISTPICTVPRMAYAPSDRDEPSKHGS